MKKFEIQIDVPCLEEATTERHCISYEGESHEKALNSFLDEKYKLLDIGPEPVNCIAFYNGNFYTVIPLNKISQIEVKECK